MGRTVFEDLCDKVENMRRKRTNIKLMVYGTIGFGKSHLLAVLALYLIRKGKKTVYLPDCRELCNNALKYLKSSLFLTFANNVDLLKELWFAETCEKLCDVIQGEEDIYIIADQYNALDEESKDGILLETKIIAKKTLINFAFGRYFIKSASANNFSAKMMQGKQLSEEKMLCYGGFNKVNILYKESFEQRIFLDKCKIFIVGRNGCLARSF